MPIDLDRISKVLTLMPDKHLGNLVVSLSTVSALADYFHNKHFYLVVDRAYKEIVETVKGLDEIVFYPRVLIKNSHTLRQISLYCKFINQIRKIAPQIVIDLQGGHTSSVITAVSRARCRLGSSSAKRSYLYNLKAALPMNKHQVYRYMAIAQALGISVNEKCHRLHCSEAKKRALLDKLERKGLTPENPLICIHPGAGRIQKQWTTAGFAAVADWLSARDYQVVFVGGVSDSEKIAAILSYMARQAHNLGGLLSLGELMALLQMSSLYIGNDSGPMHLAAAMGTPIVSLFGPGDENTWGPLSEQSVILRGRERCEECAGKDCRTFECISTISIENVVKAIKEMLLGS